MTIKEASEYLSMPESVIQSYVASKKIRAVHDGEQFLINSDQFTTHLEQVEKYRGLMEEFLNEPLPADIDVKDED